MSLKEQKSDRLPHPDSMVTGGVHQSFSHEPLGDLMSFNEQRTPSDYFGHFGGTGSPIPMTINNPPIYSAPSTSFSHFTWAPRPGYTETNATTTSKSANVKFTNSTPANNQRYSEMRERQYPPGHRP